MLDTNVLSAIIRDSEGNVAREYRKAVADCFTSIVVAGEVHFGLAKAPEKREAKDSARFLKALPVVAMEQGVELRYGDIRARLEAAGTPIGSNDLWIAAHALALDATLVTANEREFRRVPGLKVENWAAQLRR